MSQNLLVVIHSPQPSSNVMVEAYCSGRILTLIKITTHVPPPGGVASLPAGLAHIQA